MARDINDVVVVGFGAWSDVNALPTLGYGSAAAPVTNYGQALQWTPAESRHEWTASPTRLEWTL